MKTKVNLRLVTGDENLVTKDEYYLMYEGDEVVALAKRDDSGELVNILEAPKGSEDSGDLDTGLD